MSDSVSISFVRHVKDYAWESGAEDEESVSIYSHHGGKILVKLAQDFIETLDGPSSADPITRREPDALVAPFINMLDEDFTMHFRIDAKPMVVADNGHWQIDVYTGKAKKIMEAEKHE